MLSGLLKVCKIKFGFCFNNFEEDIYIIYDNLRSILSIVLSV